jgi:hypothetical protein
LFTNDKIEVETTSDSLNKKVCSMTQFLEALKTWSPIIIPILSLLAGGGWLQYYLAVRSKRQEKYKTILEDFLLPFEGVLRQTRLGFESLRGDRELINLEYHPGRLQQFYTSLQDDDIRKHLWKAKIDSLQKDNQNGMDLINRFYGRIVTPEFKAQSDAYRFHVKEWEMVWMHVFDAGTLPDTLNVSGGLLAPQFPVNLESALQTEIALVKKLAG